MATPSSIAQLGLGEVTMEEVRRANALAKNGSDLDRQLCEAVDRAEEAVCDSPDSAQARDDLSRARKARDDLRREFQKADELYDSLFDRFGYKRQQLRELGT